MAITLVMTRYFPNQFHSWPFSRDVCIAFTIYLMLFNIWHQINLKCYVLLLFVQSEEELSCAKKMHIWWIYLSFWFKPYGAMIYSFFNQKFSLCWSLSLRILVDDQVIFLNCSIILNFLCILKLTLRDLKYLQAVIALWSLMSFL